MLYLSLLLASLDQVVKHFIPTFNPPLWLISNQVGIEMTSNTGVAFSLPIPPLLTIPLSIGVVVLFIYCYYHSFAHHSLAKMTTALIIGGALGNLIDRLLYGSVIDFIKIYSWPTFNIADICLTIGFLLLILFFDKIKISMN